MATQWTKDVGIGNYGSLIRTTVTLLSQSLSGNTSRIRVVVAIWNGGSSRSFDVSVSTSISGTVSASKTTGIDVASHSWEYLWDQEFTVAHGADGRKSFSVTGTLGSTGTSTFGSGGSATVSGTFPALILKPAKPTWGGTSYVSASQIRATWTNNATSRGPYDRVDIQRWRRSTNTWAELGRLSASATSYTDSSIPANDEVKYRVQAVGPAGVSGWVEGGTLGTTPAAPSAVKAVKSTGNIVVSWTDNAAITQRTRTFLIEDNPGGAGWVQVGSIGGSATSWTHSAPDPAKTHQYRVRSRITSGGLTMTSSYSAASAVVQLQAPPKQPWRQAPADGTVQAIGTAVTLQWEHVPVDTTLQSAAEVQWRVDGGAWTLVPVTGAGSTVTVTPAPAGARGLLEWQVRTRGDHPSWSVWSTIGSLPLSTVPVVTIQNPTDGVLLPASRVEVAWAYEGGGVDSLLQQARWRVSLVDYATGDVLEMDEGSTATTAVMNTRLENHTSYAVLVAVRNGDGLWSLTSTVVFETSFPLPVPVSVFPQWDQSTATVSMGFEESSAMRGMYRWTGTPGASASEFYDSDTSEVLATNMVPSPLGPTMTEVGRWRATASDPLIVVEDEGRPVLSFTQGEAGTSLYIDPEPNFAPPVGTRVRYSVDVKVGQATSDMRVWAAGYGGATVSGTASTGYVAQNPEDGWVRYSLDFTVTAMPVGGYFRMLTWPNGSTWVAGASLMMRDALLTYDGPETQPFFDGDSTGTTDVAAIDVERRDAGGDWVLIASGISPLTTVTDRTPRIGTVEYRAISRTALPTETVGPTSSIPWPFPIRGAVVSGGPGFGRVCTAMGAAASDEPGIEQATRRFAGVPQPVAFFGIGRTHQVSFSGTIPLPPNDTSVSLREDWVALLHEHGVVCYRDPMGRKVFGLLSVSFSQSGPVESLSLSVEAVQWTESVRRISDQELEAIA